jgi:hypothetical protein
MSRYIFHNDLEMMFISTHATTAALTQVFPRRTEINKNLLDNMSQQPYEQTDPHWYARLTAKLVANDIGQVAGTGQNIGPVLAVTWVEEEFNGPPTHAAPGNPGPYQLGPNIHNGYVFYARFTTLPPGVLPPMNWIELIENLADVLKQTWQPADLPPDGNSASSVGLPPPPVDEQTMETNLDGSEGGSDRSVRNSRENSVASNGSDMYSNM